MICYVLFLFSVFVSVTDGGGGTNEAYKPTDVFLINCGANSTTNDTGGRIWKPDQRNIMSSNFVNASISSYALHQESGLPQVPYIIARIFRSEFTYSFPVSPGWKFLRLYFYPTQYNFGYDAVNSFFSATVNGFTLLRNFSADLTTKASKPESNSLIKEYIVRVDQTLNLTFTPSENSLAFVNGVEIVSMPDMLYSKGGFDNNITNIGVTFGIDNSTAFETVHRINIGGKMVGDVGDSGMFRRWLSDDDFLLGENSGIILHAPDVKINYTEKTPAYVAPEDVYAISRSMGNANKPKRNLNINLTWFFTVDADFSYLLRVHFCETLLEVNKPEQRVFSIFIGNQMAKKEVDVIRLSGGLLVFFALV